MSSFLIKCFVLIFLLGIGCSSESDSDLGKALTSAVKDRKLSEKKMRDILEEHRFLDDHDRQKAREYVLKILNVIKMGGDSSHIDLARRQVLGIKKLSGLGWDIRTQDFQHVSQGLTISITI
jgi:hypothetical protein